ncbi:MAG TPA: hypothetical protein VHE30_23855 [Polyangiaceae bacterium]|nr:hypothetical protein [Polyangiaceae bacterium]
MLRSGIAPLLVLALALFTASCASERKPINRVQANALPKTFFVGDPGNPDDDPEFFGRTFVVDGSESQELVGIGSWGGVDRVKWEITEKLLLARRSYGQNPGADDKGGTPGFPNGTIIASYPILSHFDIKRAYNPQTGEELNVVEENTTDRPWNQRDFFRVDWSTNQVDSPQSGDLYTGKLFGEIKVTPVSYYVNDPSHDDAPHFDTEAGYFDVTNKFLVEPAGSMYAGIPQCVLTGWVTGSAIQNCDAQEAVVRASYVRVDEIDPDGDFEPFENNLAPEDIFGNPGGAGWGPYVGIETPTRVTYDPAYGYTDQGMRRLMHVHDIWKQSHQTRGHCSKDSDCGTGAQCLSSGECSVPCNYAARGDGDGNGTDDQCEKARTKYAGSDGAQCSVRNRCTIPYRDRETKPIPWYVNVDMPDTVQDKVDGSGKLVSHGATEDVVFSWSQAIALAVANAREVECRRTGGKDGKPDAADRDECHALYFEPGKTEMVAYGNWGIPQVKNRKDMAITCHNPVRDYDPEECGKPGDIARVGDVRKNFVFYWPFASRAPWGGIADWNADPLTGQIIGAAATIMGRSATFAAAQIRDVLMVANGELGMADITDGTPAALFEQRLRTGEKPVALTTDQIASRMAGIDRDAAKSAFGFTFTGSADDQLLQIRSMKAASLRDDAVIGKAYGTVDGIAKPLLGTQWELGQLTPSWIVDVSRLSPGATFDDATLARVSPLRGADPSRVAGLTSGMLDALAAHGVCTFAPGDAVGNPDIRGVARWFGDSDTGIYGDTALRRDHPNLAKANLVQLSDARAQYIYDDLSVETYKGIALHEIGHALGMFHNFASSYDATNYNPQYWQLRTNEGASTASCNAVPRAAGSADTCMGPRFLDPPSEDEMGQADESRPGINYFANTSTMEYQHERFFETAGLGQYDFMTMGALYGRVLETLDPDAADGITPDEQPRFSFLGFTQLTEDDLMEWTPPNGRPGIQAMHYTELARQLKLFDPSRCREATADEIARGRWRVVHGEICSPPPKDHAAWQDFEDSPGPKSVVSASAPAGAGNVRWPYRFGQNSDAYVQVNPFDSGADIYETTNEWIKRFDYRYPFQYFRRKRRDWYYDNLPWVEGAQFFERLRSYHWVAARNNATPPNVAPDKLATFLATDDVVRSNQLAEHDMLQAIARMILTPQIGSYDTADASLSIGNQQPLHDALSFVPQGTVPEFSLDASNARFVDPDYDTSPTGGGSWDYLNFINHAGFDVEKGNAAMALTDGRPTLAIIERATYIDGRNVYVNFRTDMARAVDRVIGGVLANDWDTVAMYLPDGAQDPQMVDFVADAPGRGTGASKLLFPNLGYIQQTWSVIWSELFSRLGTDLSLQNKLLVYLQGTEGVIDVPDAEKIEHTDPRSGYTYVARLYGPDTVAGKVVDSGIASRMLAHANDLLALAYQTDVDGTGAMIKDAYGRPQLTLDASGKPISRGDDVATKAYSDYVGVVDTATQISRLFGHGPL